MESFAKRKKRFNGNSIDVIETLLGSIQNYYLPEIIIAKDKKQYYLMLLGIFSITETINEKIFLQKNNLSFYFENFIDFKEDGHQFSKICKELNQYRNVLAHQWISKIGHSISLDNELNLGYQKEKDNIIKINPIIFCNQFLSAFYEKTGDDSYFNEFFMGKEESNCTKNKIWNYERMFSEIHLKKVQSSFCKIFNKR